MTDCNNTGNFKEILLRSEAYRQSGSRKKELRKYERCSDEHLMYIHELTGIPFKKVRRRENARVLCEQIKRGKYKIASAFIIALMIFSTVSISAGLVPFKEDKTFCIEKEGDDEKQFVNISVDQSARLERFDGIDGRVYYPGYLPEGFAFAGEVASGAEYASDKGSFVFCRMMIYSSVFYESNSVFAEIFFDNDREILYVKEGTIESYYFTDGYFLFCIFFDSNVLDRQDVVKIINGIRFK